MPHIFAREIQCRVLDVIWVTPSVICLRFEPAKKLTYEPGQFLSVVVPPFQKGGAPVKRCYSFASSSEAAKRGGYELCVKFVPGGVGTSYLSSLSPGDTFRAQAPYGSFVYHDPGQRAVCFIATGTGIAPLHSMITSEKFLANPPTNALCLQGVGTPNEILYKGIFEELGVQTVYAISKPHPTWTGFQGRVTDYLRQMPPSSWPWHRTDFYVCGNGAMISQVSSILRDAFGVKPSAIFKENFATPVPLAGVVPQAKPKPVLDENESRPTAIAVLNRVA